eukprot:CAMPEP_0183593818 /NCGR_PEP_ID=MMETSP0371-20130417/170542_1 /TAXON_ID=268820 /ORGANISM="Peridinium aciculiferum, Strain PAER-2" /LENGTH=78 /DNA_ID=CAMNT_0025805463 /DNA_START=192 /DNA_END=424 /DNA_ORIENTATION=-
MEMALCSECQRLQWRIKLRPAYQALQSQWLSQMTVASVGIGFTSWILLKHLAVNMSCGSPLCPLPPPTGGACRPAPLR